MSRSEIHFDFLKAEADLAVTLIGVAELEIEVPSTIEHAFRALAKAREALNTLHHFVLKFQFDAAQIEYILDRCELIETSIDRFAARSQVEVVRAEAHDKSWISSHLRTFGSKSH